MTMWLKLLLWTFVCGVWTRNIENRETSTDVDQSYGQRDNETYRDGHRYYRRRNETDMNTDHSNENNDSTIYKGPQNRRLWNRGDVNIKPVTESITDGYNNNTYKQKHTTPSFYEEITPFTNKPIKLNTDIDTEKVIDKKIEDFGPKVAYSESQGDRDHLKESVTHMRDHDRVGQIDHGKKPVNQFVNTSPRSGNDFKSVKDNEVSSRPLNGSEDGSGQDKWIWGESSTKPTSIVTPAVDDRAAFSGDKCPTGQVRFNERCVDVD